jgi:dihydroorotate dehydrogenase
VDAPEPASNHLLMPASVDRLREDRAIINRYGFNSEGVEAMQARLEVRHLMPQG